MKDLCGEIRNACMSIGLVIKHMPSCPDKVLLRREVQRIEDAITRYQVKREAKRKEKV